MRHSRILVTGAVAAAATALLLAPAAATAHTDNLYTWADDGLGDGESVGGFATTSKTDASLAFLSAGTTEAIDQATGVEICDEVGYAVSRTSDEYAGILTWDHTTGAILSGPVDIYVGNEPVYDAVELDTLADCTVISIVDFDSETGTAIAKIDPLTGEATALVDLPYFETENYTGLATAPDGSTYIFVTVDGYPNVALVDFSTSSIGVPVLLNGLSTYFDSSGFTYGVDFDAAGGLWAITGVNQLEEYHLVSFAAGASLPSATPTDIGPYSYVIPPFVDAPIPLSTEGLAETPVAPIEPALAATGSEAPLGIAAGALALLVAGGAVLTLRRRTA